MNAAFPGLLGRRVRTIGDESDAWRGVVVGWDDGYIVVEKPDGALEQFGWRGLVVEGRQAALDAGWRPEMADDL